MRNHSATRITWLIVAGRVEKQTLLQKQNINHCHLRRKNIPKLAQGAAAFALSATLTCKAGTRRALQITWACLGKFTRSKIDPASSNKSTTRSDRQSGATSLTKATARSGSNPTFCAFTRVHASANPDLPTYYQPITLPEKECTYGLATCIDGQHVTTYRNTQ